MDERLRFAARLLDGEKMTKVCEDFGISRKLRGTRSLESSMGATAAAALDDGTAMSSVA